jgi:hypothetical protein
VKEYSKKSIKEIRNPDGIVQFGSENLKLTYDK